MNLKRILVFLAFLLFPGVTVAYVGPGLGVGVIGAAIGIILAIFLAIVGVIWFPLKRLLKKNKPKNTDTKNKPKNTNTKNKD